MLASRSRAPALLALAALTLSLWSGPADARRKKQAEAPPAAAEPSSAPASAPAEPMPAALGGLSLSARTELLDAGAEPRQPLRVHPAKGATQEVELVMDMNMNMDQGGVAQAMDLPPLVMAMRVNVLGVDADGTMDVETALLGSRVEGSGTAPAEMSAAMTQTFAAMEGMVMRARIDGTGHALETQISGMSDPALQAALDSFQQNMRQGQVMLPVEAVGIGARWRTITSINSSGLPMNAITTYSLRAVDGDHITLGTTIEMSVDKDALLATMPGTNVRFTRFESAGDGTVEWDLGQLMPLTQLRYTMDMVMEAQTGEQPMIMGMSMDMDMTMREVRK